MRHDKKSEGKNDMNESWGQYKTLAKMQEKKVVRVKAKGVICDIGKNSGRVDEIYRKKKWESIDI